MALLIRNGWQKLSAVKAALGGTTDRTGHFSLFSVNTNRVLGDLLVTGSEADQSVR